MASGLQTVAFAVFLWWFGTGAIIWLDGLPRRTFRWSQGGASVLLVLGLVLIRRSAEDASVGGAWVAFGATMLAWAWQELSFYTGWITGPRTVRCPDGCGGAAHFGHAVMASLWHEIALLVTAGLIFRLVDGQPNQVALWSFATLWCMHQSARLNVFLGVRNLSEQFVPEHLDFLRGFLRQRPMNLLFPLSVTAATIALLFAGENAAAMPDGSFGRTAWLVVATLLALGLIEHWFLVLPLPFAALWNWSVRRAATARNSPPARHCPANPPA